MLSHRGSEDWIGLLFFLRRAPGGPRSVTTLIMGIGGILVDSQAVVDARSY